MGSLSFLEHFQKLKDIRIGGMITYSLDEVLVLCLCGCISGSDTWEDIAFYGENNLEYLRRLLPYNNGTPCGKTLERIFASLDGDLFDTCFMSWVSDLQQHISGVIAIDGKTLRGSRIGDSCKGLHIVSAFAHAQGIVLAQEVVDQKSNAIKAIPSLLDKLVLEGAIVTIDAMGCQKEIASGIIDKEADYILALKGNQSSLQEDVLLFFEEQQGNGWKDCPYDYHEEIDAGHGRIETRKCWAVSDIAWLTETHNWKGLKSIALIEAKRIIKDKESIEQRLYISSLPANAQTIAQSVRAHWSIENNLHWVMDVVFNDDRNQTKNRQAAFNLQTIKKMTLNLLKKHKSKKSLSLRRKGAGWNFNLMLEILNAAGN